MKYKGYELMKAVSEGKLNLKQKVSTTSLDYKNCTIEFVLKDIAFNIMDLDFELIEDELDIDSIEKLSKIAYTEINLNKKRNKDVEFTDKEIILAEKINQLIKAVKQIDKRVKKIEKNKFREKYEIIF